MPAATATKPKTSTPPGPPTPSVPSSFAQLPDIDGMDEQAQANVGQVIVAEERKVIAVMNDATGHWEEKEVSLSDAALLEPVYTANDEQEIDPCMIDAQWNESGRGRLLAYAWLNVNGKHSAIARSLGYATVPVDKIKLRQFPVQNVPGIGPAYVFVDVYLCEIPRSLLESRRAAHDKRMKDEENERYQRVKNDSEDIYRRTEGLMKVTQEMDRGLARSNPMLDEVASINAALDRNAALSGHRPVGLHL